MIKLYGIGFSPNVNRVRYCLNELGLKYDWVQTNPMAGETKTPEFQAVSPTGKVPAIEIDGFKLFESSTINRYLASQNKSSLYPQDPKQRAVVDAWTDYAAIHVSQAVGRIFFNRVLAPMMGRPADQESVKAGLEFLDNYFPVLDKQLSANPYFAGKTLSLADITLTAVLDPIELAQIDSINQYPSLKKWRAQMKAQTFYQKCYKDYAQYVRESVAANTK